MMGAKRKLHHMNVLEGAIIFKSFLCAFESRSRGWELMVGERDLISGWIEEFFSFNTLFETVLDAKGQNRNVVYTAEQTTNVDSETETRYLSHKTRNSKVCARCNTFYAKLIKYCHVLLEKTTKSNNKQDMHREKREIKNQSW